MGQAPAGSEAITERLEAVQSDVSRLREELGQVIVGHDEVIRYGLIALFMGGHILIEGPPGLGKTLLARTLGHLLDIETGRIQFTPDLLPADITGTFLLQEDGSGTAPRFQFQKGPLFCNLLLADEVNRATPKTQAALLEAMQEGAVTLGRERHPLPQPFCVFATQNPIELEGTYPLPEAELDRFFFKLDLHPSSVDDLVEIFRRTTTTPPTPGDPVLTGERVLAIRDLARQVPAAEPILNYVARLVAATHPDDSPVEAVTSWVRYGASPRGGQAMVLGAKAVALLDGRSHVEFEDVRTVCHPALRHRLILNFEGEAEGIAPDAIIDDLLEAVPTEGDAAGTF